MWPHNGAAMSKPPAETQLSVPLVRDLIREQHPSFAHLPVTEGPSGWDNDIYRLGDALAVRLPRRAVAAVLLEHEQRWLPQLQPLLPLPVPAAVAVGQPQGDFPWSWSITPWFEGRTLDQSPLDQDQIEVLAAFLQALHIPAPADAPYNPWRSAPLTQLQSSFDRCVQALAGGEYAVDKTLLRLWEEAARLPPDVPPTWVHGDLHARNVLVQHGRICAVIDWGDMARGDPAVDLAAIWMLLPEPDRRGQLMSRCAGASLQTWSRARGLAMLYALNVLRAVDPEHEEAALKTLQRLRDGP
jgi:aminoglycoside phosphotransferase (APT) family kinase protein